MNGDAFVLQRGAAFACRRAMLDEEVMHAISAETATSCIREEHALNASLRFVQPGFQDRDCGFRQRGTPFLTALANHTHMSACTDYHIVTLEPRHLRQTQTRLHRY